MLEEGMEGEGLFLIEGGEINMMQSPYFSTTDKND